MISFIWERIILDEADTLRNPKTLFSESVRQTQHLNIHFITATPILNHARDLRGYLTLIFKNSWASPDVGKGFLVCYTSGFDPYNVGEHQDPLPRDEDCGELNDAVDNRFSLYVLDLDNFRRAGDQHDWSPEACAIIIPPILKLLSLCLSLASSVDLQESCPPLRVGADFPVCNVYTVQLRMNWNEKSEHDRRTLHLLNKLFVGDSEMQQERVGVASLSGTVIIEDRRHDGFRHLSRSHALHIRSQAWKIDCTWCKNIDQGGGELPRQKSWKTAG